MEDRCNRRDCFTRDYFDGCSCCYKSRETRINEQLMLIADMLPDYAEQMEEFDMIADCIMNIFREESREKELLTERLMHSETERFHPERVRVTYDFVGDNKLWHGFIK